VTYVVAVGDHVSLATGEVKAVYEDGLRSGESFQFGGFLAVIIAKLKGAGRTTLRRSERIQDAYERYKNLRREEVLKSLIPAGGVGAELGVHKGHLTPFLVDWLRPKKLYAVDPWYLLAPTWEWAAGDKSTVNALARTIRRLRPAIEVGQVEVVVKDDLVFLAEMADGALDWVYLDSSHMYEHTVKELELLICKVRPGGIIAGDDWQPDPQHRHYGVCKAVREFDSAGQLTLIYTDSSNHQWASKVPDL
jgi:Methyltransferase domain